VASTTNGTRTGVDTRLLILVVVAVGCGEAGMTDGDRFVVDSAGIEIVTIGVSDDGDAADWPLDSRPRLELGVADGRDELVLSGVVGAVRLSDGRVVVANAATSELRFFESDGSFSRQVGRSGEGPGEFRVVGYLGVLPGDTLLVHDSRLRRTSLLDDRGAFIEAHAVTGVMLPYMAGQVSPRTLAGWQFVGMDDDRLGVYAAEMEVGMIDIGPGGFRAIATLPSVEEARVQYRGRLTRAFRPFGRESDVAAADGFIHVLTSSDDGAIRTYDSAGALTRILRVHAPTRATSGEAVQQWIDSWIARFSTGSTELEEQWLHGFRQTPPPDRIPVFRSLNVDAGGNVCAERYPDTWDSPARYWCFSPAGRLVRSFELPKGIARRGPHPYFDPQLEIGTDYVLGVWQDSLGVERVRLYGFDDQRR
jgi:hypothetical protein